MKEIGKVLLFILFSPIIFALMLYVTIVLVIYSAAGWQFDDGYSL